MRDSLLDVSPAPAEPVGKNPATSRRTLCSRYYEVTQKGQQEEDMS
jgi:hypothetical protein